MRYCPTCRRYVNGALSCPGCAVAATELPMAEPFAPVTGARPAAVSRPAPAPAPVSSGKPERHPRRMLPGWWSAAALLITGLCVVGLHGTTATRGTPVPASSRLGVPPVAGYGNTSASALAGSGARPVAIAPEVPVAEDSPAAAPGRATPSGAPSPGPAAPAAVPSAGTIAPPTAALSPSVPPTSAVPVTPAPSTPPPATASVSPAPSPAPSAGCRVWLLILCLG